MTRILKFLVVFLLVFLGITWLLSQSGGRRPQEVPVSEITQQLKNENVAALEVGNRALYTTLKDSSTKFYSVLQDGTDIPKFFVDSGVPAEKITPVKITYKNPSGWVAAIPTAAYIFLPLILISAFFFWFVKQIQGGNNKALSFGQSTARLNDDRKPQVKFADVAGAKEAKEELGEVVEFLKFPQKFLKMGARIPKGVLLVGGPGVGKTLLARAVAGEANVPFFHMSGSEFVEMFVGVGASRVRDLFKNAKKNSPCIIFIDEIDAVGRQRGTGLGGGHDEREQTLNQILVEMDGFETDTNVIVIAATNRPDVLDPALLRPGRFDRQVVLDAPDIEDREAILKVHSKNKPFAAGVRLRTIAERTPGFSGADLSNLVNEAAILAARHNQTKISEAHLKEAIEKVMLGPQRKSHLLSAEEKNLTAYHEGGHALVGSVLPGSDPVHKVTVLSRGRAAGYTMNVPSDDKKMHTKSSFLDEIAALLGGYAAEKLVFNELTTGASNDLKVATNMARKLVTQYGMSEALGPVTLASDHQNVFLGKDFAERNVSEETAKQIDLEIRSIMQNAEKRATEVLLKYRNYLDAIAQRLVKEETLEQDTFYEIVKEILPPKKQKKNLPQEFGGVSADDMPANAVAAA